MKTTNPEQTNEGSAAKPSEHRGTELGAAHGSGYGKQIVVAFAVGVAALLTAAFAINHERKSKTKVLVNSAGEVIGPVMLFRKRPPLPKSELGGGGAEPARTGVATEPKGHNKS